MTRWQCLKDWCWRMYWWPVRRPHQDPTIPTGLKVTRATKTTLTVELPSPDITTTDVTPALRLPARATPPKDWPHR